MVTDKHELLGQALGTCTLQRLIGRGGMGVVYLAQQSRPRRTVAVKVLMPDSILEKKTRTEFFARFRREADAIAALDHIHIMPIYEYGEREELAYLVMPYVSGGTLRDVLEQRTLLPLDEAVTILEQAASALDCAHAQGIIHRDLKPGNMLFHADGRLLLADFGLAKVLKDTDDEEQKHHSALTSTGTIIGTPEYLSPEQSMGQPLDRQSDIYSLGIVLFQMLSGRVPFTGSSPVAIAIKHSLEEPPSLTQLQPSIPPAVEAVVMKAMKKDPAQRFTSAGEFARALRSVVGESRTANLYESVTVRETFPPLTSEELLSEEDRPTLDSHEALTLAGASALPPPQLVRPVPAEIPTQVPLPAVNHYPQLDHQPVRQTYTHYRAPGEQPLSAVPQRRKPDQRFLLFSVIALLLIIGGLLSYHFLYPGSAKDTPDTSALTPRATHTPALHSQSTPIPPLVPVGSLLYATSLPGPSCDSGGAAWSATSTASMACTAGGTSLHTSDTNHLAGLFLDDLPHHATLPHDYVIQVQVQRDPHSQDLFGVFFRNQPGSQQGTYSFLLDSSGYWKASLYDNQSGTASVLYGQQLTQAQMSAVMTLDIVVQGNMFTFYVNQYRQGDAISNKYAQGTIGLSVGSSSAVLFKNLSIYALPGA